MSRLTEKVLKDELDDFDYDHYKTMYKDKCIYKLGQLEDIEEELGVNLIKILTAKEVYVFKISVVAPYKFGKTNKIIKCSNFYFNFINKVINIHVPKSGLYCETLSDYGKSWAFTREELEKWKDL